MLKGGFPGPLGPLQSRAAQLQGDQQRTWSSEYTDNSLTRSSLTQSKKDELMLVKGLESKVGLGEVAVVCVCVCPIRKGFLKLTLSSQWPITELPW